MDKTSDSGISLFLTSACSVAIIDRTNRLCDITNRKNCTAD